MLKIKDIEISEESKYIQYSNRLLSIKYDIMSFGLFNGHRCTYITLDSTAEEKSNNEITESITEHNYVILDIRNVDVVLYRNAINQLLTKIGYKCSYVHLIINNDQFILYEYARKPSRITIYNPDLKKSIKIEHLDSAIITIKGFTTKHPDEYSKRLKQLISNIYNMFTLYKPIMYLEPNPNEGSKLKNLNMCLDMIKLDSNFCLSVPYTIIT